MIYQRNCKCTHRFPVCACTEGHAGAALYRRSRTLSSLAGWPAPGIDAAAVARVVARHGRPTPAVVPNTPAADCGCGKPRPVIPEPA